MLLHAAPVLSTAPLSRSCFPVLQMRALQLGGRWPCPSLSPDSTTDLSWNPGPRSSGAPTRSGPQPRVRQVTGVWREELPLHKAPTQLEALAGEVQVTLVTVRPPDTRGLCEQRSHVFTGLSSNPVSATCSCVTAGETLPSVGSSVKWGDCCRIRC